MRPRGGPDVETLPARHQGAGRFAEWARDRKVSDRSAVFRLLEGMSRKLRYVPEDVRLVHVTCRTVQGRYLFTPSQQLNDIALGAFGRAQRLHPVRICDIVVMSTHVHILFDLDSVQQLADVMEYASSKLAREVNRLTGWSGPVFERRYTMIPGDFLKPTRP
jgi:REP element-mobilizing transposase RayT